MLRRVAVGGVLACLMAMAVTAPGEASTKANEATLLKGRTGQKHRVKLKLSASTLRLVRFDIELRCRDGSILVDEESGFERTPIHRNGSFGDVQTGSTDTVMIRGRLRGKGVEGRLRVKDRLGKIRCDSRWVRFKARH